MNRALSAAMFVVGAGVLNTAGASAYAGMHSVGMHYEQTLSQQNAYRVGVGFEGLGIGASADYVHRFGNGGSFVPHVGAGAGLGFGEGIVISPRGFAGASFKLNDNLIIFAEAGAQAHLGSRHQNGPKPYYNIGVNFRLLP